MVALSFQRGVSGPTTGAGLPGGGGYGAPGIGTQPGGFPTH